MIPYIGDISKADAEVLAACAKSYEDILEFGCGASTQVLMKYKSGTITSVDTDSEWINKTSRNIQLLGIGGCIEFYKYGVFMDFLSQNPERKYEFVFNDGVDSLRREFAIRIWPHIIPGGMLALHDTRRAPDFRNVLEILAHFQDEIEVVCFNVNDSNITTIHKRSIPAPYDNWQISEKKEPWMLGYGEPDLEYLKNYKEEV